MYQSLQYMCVHELDRSEVGFPSRMLLSRLSLKFFCHLVRRDRRAHLRGNTRLAWASFDCCPFEPSLPSISPPVFVSAKSASRRCSYGTIAIMHMHVLQLCRLFTTNKTTNTCPDGVMRAMLSTRHGSRDRSSSLLPLPP